VTVSEALAGAVVQLEAAGVDSPEVDAEWLLAHVLDCSRTGLQVDRGRALSDDERRSFADLLERRARREPLAYVLGEWGFRRLTLAVDARALVPRPETEVVVERCLALLSGMAEPRVLDVGVGSGAIALAVADEHPGARVLGVDSSEAALALAGENRDRAGVNGRLELVRGDLLTGMSGPFELVVANPPYVDPGDWEALQPEIRLYEPKSAIVGAEVADSIARAARPLLAPDGWLVLEAGDGQAGRLAELLGELGYDDVAITRDLADRERVVEGRRP
jgi:release factor glutamine methyltransferase